MAEGDDALRSNRARYQRIDDDPPVIGPPRATRVTPIGTTSKKNKKALILEVLTEGWSFSKACRIAGVSPQAATKWRAEDEDFDTACGDHYDYGTEALEDEATRRAMHGTLEPKFHKGRRCGVIRRHSDALLMFLLKARDPAKYAKPEAASPNGPHGYPALPKPSIDPQQLTELSCDDLNRIYQEKVNQARQGGYKP